MMKGDDKMASNEELREKIRKKLIECRNEKNVTQTEVGKHVGKSKTAVASWEQGKSLPDAATLYKLALYYGKSIEYMYDRVEEKED